jgi:signal transduction histidine kinase
MITVDSGDGLAHAHHRLQRLYEISTLFAGCTNVEETFEPVVGIASRTLSLRSAVLIETREQGAQMFVWESAGQTVEHMGIVKANVESAHRYLVGPPSASDGTVIQETEMSPLTAAATSAGADPPNRLIVLPLVVADRPSFGALQVEGAGTLDKADLMFVNAVANQLAVALDRDRAWRSDITRREHAEAERANAEARRADAERSRADAEASSERYQALALEHARLYEEAKQSVRVREHILAIVSHDLRNPLATIVMTAGLLATRGHSPDVVARIRRATDRMLRLIDDLLDFASIEVGTLALRRQTEDVESIVREVAAAFETESAENGREVTVAIAAGLPAAACDRDRVIQVLSNLVGNASKVTAAGGHIVLGVELCGADLLFVVSDDGPGISEEDVKHLFERYWRSGQAEYRGTGLGLAISRGIVAAHGGQLWVETKLGHGAAFYFTIPCATAASA